ncbi:hypothetical protein JTE90_027060 [Oedothorax gibbosus]|uniref:Uncharacterized protein n=1 Tax=Oedothorax gibbosus TaxID=931172 RepID=A0AAV6TU41_9ARAC|nr:hypothetical protein JTE90_027060 [Oedothorax gibbosus]
MTQTRLLTWRRFSEDSTAGEASTLSKMERILSLKSEVKPAQSIHEFDLPGSHGIHRLLLHSPSIFACLDLRGSSLLNRVSKFETSSFKFSILLTRNIQRSIHKDPSAPLSPCSNQTKKPLEESVNVGIFDPSL